MIFWKPGKASAGRAMRGSVRQGAGSDGQNRFASSPILDDFAFLAANASDDVLPKQHIPSPGKVLMRILRETDAGVHEVGLSGLEYTAG